MGYIETNIQNDVPSFSIRLITIWDILKQYREDKNDERLEV